MKRVVLSSNTSWYLLGYEVVCFAPQADKGVREFVEAAIRVHAGGRGGRARAEFAEERVVEVYLDAISM